MKIDMKRIAHGAKRILLGLWALLAHNLGLKLLSVLFALILWSYVITSTPAMREKPLTGLDVTVTSQSVLTSRELALLSLGMPSNAQVVVRVSQTSYAQVNNDNVRVELDLSTIRAAGKQQVKLRGISSYGSVTQITPEYVDVEVEQRDERVVPVNVELTGDINRTAYWYDFGRPNPSQITVFGPTSVVQRVSSAQVRPDVSGRFTRYDTKEPYVLLDAQGNEMTDTLSRSTSSIQVPIEIYPTRMLKITSNVNELIKGQVAPGYEVIDVFVSPDQIEVAAEQSLLDSLHELSIEPVDVGGMSQTFPAVAKVTALRDIKHLSSEEVAVTVTIEEKHATKRLKSIDLEFINPPDDKRLTYSVRRLETVRVTGPASIVNELTKDNIRATVDLGGLTAGQFEVPIEVMVEDHPELSCAPSIATITVTVSES